MSRRPESSDQLPPFAALPELPESLMRWPGFVLAMLAETGSVYFTEALAPLGIRRNHLHVLILVDEYQPVQQVELGRLLVLSPATITHVVNDLEELGALERRRDPNDRRAHHLHLTGRGTAMIREAETISQKATESVFAVLNPAERKALHRMLIRLARREPPTLDLKNG
jgi:MarR family transcriptional regulator, lower aerobic nicotinate degradation pathway regulator